MYAVYNYAAGSTQANVLSDLIKLITGETNKANLSANCVQANTSITSTVAAGWTVHDAAAGTNQQVVRALCQDGTTYKYYRLNTSTTTSIISSIAEAWNETAHTGTNVVVNGAVTWSASGGGYFYVYATVKNIVLLSYSSSTWSWPMDCHEFTRETVGSTYPCFAMTYSDPNPVQGAVVLPRVKRIDTTGDLTSWSAMLVHDGGTGFSWNQATTYRDASENTLIAAYKVAVAGNGGNLGGRRLGQCYDILAVGKSSGLGTNLDEITYGGKTYVLFYGVNTTYGLLVPKE